MPKSNFLLVDLNEPKTKKLAESITSDTSRKILNHLTEKDDSEANISTTLSLPISTVHYHLQKLQEAGLITVEEFHYSVNGREVNHYKLANKYIIIAPKVVSGLKEKLKGILPAFIAAAGLSAVLALLQNTFVSAPGMETVRESFDAAPAAAMALSADLPAAVVQQPTIALWFLLGSVSVLVLYVLIGLVKEGGRK